jgi:LysM repeat protein
MMNDTQSKNDDVLSDKNSYSSKRRQIKPGNNKPLSIIVGILLFVVLAGGVFYFITRGITEDDAALRSKIATFEQKIATLERQITELQGKLGTVGPDTALLQRVDALARKIEVLEKQSQPTAESKAKPSTPSKPAVSTEKRYHTVQKGETLYRISRKYGISVEKLQKLNHLTANQPIHSGQKLLVSPGH